MAFTDDDHKAVLEALADEVRAKHEGRPYSEAVIMACEVCLRVNARKPSAEPPHYTMPDGAQHPDDTEQGRRIKEMRPALDNKYWWQDKD